MTRQNRGDEEAGGDAARECGERAARAQRVVMGRVDARMGGGDAGRRIPSRPDSAASEVEVVGRGLVELEVGAGLGLGGVEGRCLIEEPGEEIAPTHAARGCPGPRAGERGGGLWGRSRWRRMAETTGGSVRNARILISAPQAGQSSGSTS